MRNPNQAQMDRLAEQTKAIWSKADEEGRGSCRLPALFLLRWIANAPTVICMDVLELLRSGTPEDWTILQAHGVISRTDRVENVTGDYAEFLVNEHFGGTLQPPGNPNYDIEAEDHGRISVKSRRNYYQHFSVAQREFQDFEQLVLVEFGSGWTVMVAGQLAWEEMPTMRDYFFEKERKHRFWPQGQWRTAALPLTEVLRAVQERTRHIRG